MYSRSEVSAFEIQIASDQGRKRSSPRDRQINTVDFDGRVGNAVRGAHANALGYTKWTDAAGRTGNCTAKSARSPPSCTAYSPAT